VCSAKRLVTSTMSIAYSVMREREARVETRELVDQQYTSN